MENHVGPNADNLGEALALSTGCWGYNRREEEEHGEKCRIPCGL